MHPILFSIGNFHFYTHGFLAVLGIVLGTISVYFLAKKENLSTEILFDNLVISIFSGIVGARVLYYLLYSNQFKNAVEILFLWQGGMVSYGGFVFGAIAIYLLLHGQKQPVARWLDIISIGFFLGLCFGRIGNIFAGDVNGVVTTNHFFGFLSPAGASTNLVPVAFFESILCLIIALVAFVLFLKYKDRISTGLITAFSFLFYSFGRFLIDFWRDEQKLFAHISIGQLASLGVFVLCLISVSIILRNRRKYDYPVS